MAVRRRAIAPRNVFIDFTLKTMKKMNKNAITKLCLSTLLLLIALGAGAQQKSLRQLQQDFEDLRFGMFTHFALPTYAPADWSDPDMPPSAFNPTKLDCNQWAKAAKSANMRFGCLSVKHHNGFCLWATKTTDYNVMNSPLHKDLVKAYCDAFRKQGMKVMFHFSVLDTHNKLRPHMITPEKIQMMKDQLTELLTNYGPVTAIIFDGYEAPWGRISYEDVNFQEVYDLIKSLQPNCLVLDMNSAKYPREALFYTDIKFYEQGAGQKISTDENTLPAVACLPLQRTWFWKDDMPKSKLRDPKDFVENTLIPYGKAHCTFILNAAPNRDGLIDDNAVEALKEIGKLNKDDINNTYPLPQCEAPITEKNIAKNKPSESSWSDDTNIMDLANDDDFGSAWYSFSEVKTPFWEVNLEGEKQFNQIVITEPRGGVIQAYRLQYLHNGKWNTLFDGPAKTNSRVKIHNFNTVRGSKVRITITSSNGEPAIAEFGVYEPF